jgi:FixJ family two-component response regulator
MVQSPATKAIYLVDDEPLLRRCVAILLETLGVPIITFASAEDMLDSFQMDRCLCVIADVHLPGRSGIELITQLKRINPDLPAVLLTGFDISSIPQIPEKTLVIPKPIHPDQLVDQIGSLIKQSRLQAPTQDPSLRSPI